MAALLTVIVLLALLAAFSLAALRWGVESGDGRSGLEQGPWRNR